MIGCLRFVPTLHVDLCDLMTVINDELGKRQIFSQDIVGITEAFDTKSITVFYRAFFHPGELMSKTIEVHRVKAEEEP